MSYITLRGLRCATAPQGDDGERERHPEVRALARLEGCADSYLNFPLAATGSVPMISSPRTITTSSIMLTTTQT
jgi:hypothetical protein